MSQETKLATDVTVNFRERLTYSIGDLGYNLMYFWVSAYLMIFYTDVFGISLGAVTFLMLIVRIFDAVNDPILGAMADNTKRKTGSYRSWIQWGSLGLGLTIILLFWAQPSLSGGGKLFYVYATYILVVCFSTATNMPYGVLNGTITTNVHERTKISSLRFIMVFLGNMGVVAIAAPVLTALGVAENPGSAYLYAVTIFCVISVPMLWISAFKTKEVVKTPESQTRVSVRDRFRSLKSGPILSVIVANLFHGFVYYGRAAVYPYYFTYFCHNPSMIVTFGIVNGFANVIGCSVSPYIHRLFRHKARAAAFDLGLIAASSIAMYWFPPTSSVSMFYALAFLAGVGQGAYIVMLFSMTPDAIDYSHYQTGVSAAGFQYALGSFTCKVGGALAPAVLSVVLGMLGYIPNAQQSPAVANGINAVMTLVVGGVAVLCAVCFLTNTVSDEKYTHMSVRLAARHASPGSGTEPEKEAA